MKKITFKAQKTVTRNDPLTLVKPGFCRKLLEKCGYPIIRKVKPIEQENEIVVGYAIEPSKSEITFT